MSAVRSGSCLATVIARSAGGSDPTIVIGKGSEGTDPTIVIAKGAKASDPTYVIARAAAQRRPVAIQAPAPSSGLPRPLRGLATTGQCQFVAVIATDVEGSDPTIVIGKDAKGTDPTIVIARAAAQRRLVAIQAPAPSPGLPRPLRGLATTGQCQFVTVIATDVEGSDPTIVIGKDAKGTDPTTVIGKGSEGTDPTIVIGKDAKGTDPTIVIGKGAKGTDPTYVIARAAAQRRPVAIQAPLTPAPAPGLPRPLRGLATTGQCRLSGIITPGANHADPVASSRARGTCARPEQVRRWRKAHYNH